MTARRWHTARGSLLKFLDEELGRVFGPEPGGGTATAEGDDDPRGAIATADDIGELRVALEAARNGLVAERRSRELADEELRGLRSRFREMGAAASELASDNARLTEAFAEASAALVAYRADAEKREATDSAEYASTLAELTAAHEKLLAELTAAHEQHIGDVRAAHEAQLADLTTEHEMRAADMTETHAEQLREVTETHAQLVADMAAAHEQKVGHLTTVHDQRVGDMADAHRQLVTDMTAAHEERVAGMAEAHELRIAEIEDAGAARVAELLETHRTELAKEVATREDLEAAATRYFEEMKTSHEERLRTEAGRYAELEERAASDATAHAQAIDRQARRHSDDLAVAADERAAVVAESNAALASMQATLEQVRTELETARTERSSMNDELEGRNGEIRVLRDRLRDEIATRTEAVNRVEALEQEIRDLAGDVLAADVNRQRKGVFRRLVAPPKGAGGGPPPKRMPAAPPVDDQRRKADAPPPGALGATDDKDLDALLDRRLFGS